MPAYKEQIEQALTEFRLKNWAEARVLFRRAHELNPNARTLRGLGVVSFEMRDYQQAVQHLSYALVDTRQPLTDAQRAECEGLLSRARTFVGSYALHVTPATAQATLDGAPLVRDHEGMVLVPLGEHTLRATAEQFQAAPCASRFRVESAASSISPWRQWERLQLPWLWSSEARLPLPRLPPRVVLLRP